ncbi:MATERNAL EFFECT EMBRYO ARREST 64, ROP (rho of plants) guanine nucleotide exchange factor 12 [Hibiscus trionum]|nr:MATERNAL EFFECT EMBRYO ARREST 64, ROP (rho of plants) guanine nucleotide exchange factor 12 [Hibiscus trionum]
MVGAVEKDQDSLKIGRFFKNFRGKGQKAVRSTQSTSVDKGGGGSEEVAEGDGENQGSDPLSSDQDDAEARQAMENFIAACEAREKQLLSDMEQMKEKFAKLLLGEDMSGGGKGVSSALALSNAITNLAASVFGEQSRLEPMTAERKSRWRKEIDWLFSVSDWIVEFVPSQQKNKDGSNMEIMITKQRADLLMNIPALRTLDTMLLDCLDSFKDQTEFYYLSKDASNEEKGNAKRLDDKWWLPTVKVPENGLSDAARKNLQSQKDSVTQVLKLAMSINAQVLSEMEIPENYIESLPKNGRASLGDSIYRSITVELFDPNQFLSAMDLSSEHKILDLKDRIEASIVIWKRKMVQKDGKSGWSSAVSYEKRELFEERAETVLRIIKHQYPGIPQSALDITKIQYNRDVGQALLESYSRILESLAFTILSRIGDVLYADSVVRKPNQTTTKILPNSANPGSGNEGEKGNLMTLSDLLTWSAEQLEIDEEIVDCKEERSREIDEKQMQNLHSVTTKKTYVESLGGVGSPKERH